MTPWQPRNSRALKPDSINRSKLPRASSVKCSQKLPHMECHQSSQEVTSHTLKSMVSKEEAWEWDRETERSRDSLTFSRVIEVSQAGPCTDRQTRRMRSCNTVDADDQELKGNHERSDLPQTWPTPSLCPQRETTAEGKQTK